MKRLSGLFLVVVAVAGLQGCQNCVCSGFNQDHPYLSYSLFPDLNTSYTFSDSSSNQITYSQNGHYIQEPSGDGWTTTSCKNACYSYYSEDYRSNDVVVGSSYENQLGMTINYNSGDPRGNMDIRVGNYGVTLETNGSGLIDGNTGDYWTINFLSSFSAKGTTHSNVYKLENTYTAPGAEMEAIWFKKDHGIVGFRYGGTYWDLND